ncbi:MAG: SDR family NAD(P)-dependent oxidoreductase [Cypionkella sp.]|uniref:SDR family NAD(P)-dependent oxidoreductase n=1 Tax=Cypionkella sp. TaxID=2811411 RepID=UPI002AB970B7|nr:SDR family NAD(P)-dependent oxidoreductase [Cypionkella sp.]MDZ4312586.1 SDR family NAD(P)-dependent oxidoreductase [Cypionkella sp.]MDZ4393216.1 SDR family NAD(P)-dependent oxidoreductase [Cypionkella sp.]
MTTLITGANRGIGQALFAHYQAAGETVIGTARKPAPGLVTLDVTDPAGQRSFGQSIESLDLLICNAGVYPDRGQRLDDGYAPELWAEGFSTNVVGVFLTIQALLPALRRAGGKIAIISSQMASDTRAPGGSYIYRASKAAALNLGRNLATDLKPQGIAVGIYHPGWVQTDMGGAGADITEAQSAQGLAERFAALSLATTGCFETWDGRAHPF